MAEKKESKLLTIIEKATITTIFFSLGAPLYYQNFWYEHSALSQIVVTYLTTIGIAPIFYKEITREKNN